MLPAAERATVLVAKKETDVRAQGERLVVRENDVKLATIPAFKIKEVILMGDRDVPSALIAFCAKHKISLHIVSGRHEYLGSLVGDPSKNVMLRVAQLRARLDDARRSDIVRTIVLGKIRNQEQVLRSFRTTTTSRALPCPPENADENTLRGFEGAATRAYFSNWDKLLAGTGFLFEERSKRPPRNPVNALLSFAYTLLACDIHSTINITGLDAYVGFLHRDYYGRPSLVCDLLEEWRPLIADKFALTAFRRREFSSKDFRTLPDGIEVRLTKDGLRKFYEKWTRHYKKTAHASEKFGFPCTFHEAVELQVRLFAKMLIGERENYEPYTIRFGLA